MLNNKGFVLEYEYFKKLYNCPSHPYSIIRRESYTYNYWLLDKEGKWLKMEWEPEEFDQMMKSGRVVRIDKGDDEVVGFLMMQELTAQPENNSSITLVYERLQAEVAKAMGIPRSFLFSKNRGDDNEKA